MSNNQTLNQLKRRLSTSSAYSHDTEEEEEHQDTFESEVKRTKLDLLQNKEESSKVEKDCVTRDTLGTELMNNDAAHTVDLKSVASVEKEKEVNRTTYQAKIPIKYLNPKKTGDSTDDDENRDLGHIIHKSSKPKVHSKYSSTYLAFKEFQKKICYSGDSGISTIALTESNYSSDAEDINTFAKQHQYMGTIQRSLYKNDISLVMYPNAASTFKALDKNNEHSFYTTSNAWAKETIKIQKDIVIQKKKLNATKQATQLNQESLVSVSQMDPIPEIDIKFVEPIEKKMMVEAKVIKTTTGFIKNKRSKTELEYLRTVFPMLLTRPGSSFHAYLKFINIPEAYLHPDTINMFKAEITSITNIIAWFNTRQVFDSKVLHRYIGDFNTMLADCKFEKISDADRALMVKTVQIKGRPINLDANTTMDSIDTQTTDQPKKNDTDVEIEPTTIEIPSNLVFKKRSKYELDHLKSVFPALVTRPGSSFHAYLKFINTPDAHLTPATIGNFRAEISDVINIVAWYNTRDIYDQHTLVRYMGDFNIMMVECKFEKIKDSDRQIILATVEIKERPVISIVITNVSHKTTCHLFMNYLIFLGLAKSVDDVLEYDIIRTHHDDIRDIHKLYEFMSLNVMTMKAYERNRAEMNRTFTYFGWHPLSRSESSILKELVVEAPAYQLILNY